MHIDNAITQIHLGQDEQFDTVHSDLEKTQQDQSHINTRLETDKQISDSHYVPIMMIVNKLLLKPSQPAAIVASVASSLGTIPKPCFIPMLTSPMSTPLRNSTTLLYNAGSPHVTTFTQTPNTNHPHSIPLLTIPFYPNHFSSTFNLYSPFFPP